MTQNDVKFIASMPEFYDRHLAVLFFQPYADDLADRNVSTTLIHPGAAFRLDLRRLPPGFGLSEVVGMEVYRCVAPPRSGW